MIPDAIKGLVAKSFLKHFVDGNTGSTLLGSIAAAILASGIDFGHLTHGLNSSEDAEMWGKLGATVALVTWGYFTGKKKVTAPKGGDPIDGQ